MTWATRAAVALAIRIVVCGAARRHLAAHTGTESPAANDAVGKQLMQVFDHMQKADLVVEGRFWISEGTEMSQFEALRIPAWESYERCTLVLANPWRKFQPGDVVDEDFQKPFMSAYHRRAARDFVRLVKDAQATGTRMFEQPEGCYTTERPQDLTVPCQQNGSAIVREHFPRLAAMDTEDKLRAMNTIFKQRVGAEQRYLLGGPSYEVDLSRASLLVEEGTIQIQIGDDFKLGIIKAASEELKDPGAWKLFKRTMAQRQEYCKASVSMDIRARDPESNLRSGHDRTKKVQRATFTLSASFVKIQYKCSDDTASQTPTTLVMVERINYVRGPDVFDADADGSRGLQIGFTNLRGQARAVALVGDHDAIMAALMTNPIIRKVKEGQDDGSDDSQCQARGENTCFKRTASCLEKRENPCKDGHGCQCLQPGMGTSIAAFILNKALRLGGGFGAAAVTGNPHFALVGLQLSFGPPEFGLPGPTDFALALALSAGFYGRPKCKCLPLPCLYDVAEDRCYMNVVNVGTGTNDGYCLPPPGKKCVKRWLFKNKWQSFGCVLKDCGSTRPGDGEIGNCQPHELSDIADDKAKHGLLRHFEELGFGSNLTRCPDIYALERHQKAPPQDQLTMEEHDADTTDSYLWY